MRQLNKENIFKNQVDTIEQFTVLAYLKQQFNVDEVSLYLLDRFTIKLIDKNNDIGYFKYNSVTILNRKHIHPPHMNIIS